MVVFFAMSDEADLFKGAQHKKIYLKNSKKRERVRDDNQYCRSFPRQVSGGVH